MRLRWDDAPEHVVLADIEAAVAQDSGGQTFCDRYHAHHVRPAVGFGFDLCECLECQAKWFVLMRYPVLDEVDMASAPLLKFWLDHLPRADNTYDDDVGEEMRTRLWKLTDRPFYRTGRMILWGVLIVAALLLALVELVRKGGTH